jgi:hypothetical protein
MLKYIKTVVIIIFLSAAFIIHVKADDITDINDLIEHAKELDGSQVSIQGEAIGERMDRGNYSWVNINDGTNAIGIWLNKKDAEKILHYGNYKWKGDTVIITGTFNRACIEHNGEADIHGLTIEVVNEGYYTYEKPASSKIIMTGVLSVVALLLASFYIKRYYNKKTFV